MSMKNIFNLLLLALFMSACVAPQTFTINQVTVDTKFTKVYQTPMGDVLSAIEHTIEELGWVKLEEHKNILKPLADGRQVWKIETKQAFYTKSDYKYSWKVVAPKTKVDDLVFLKIRTPRSLKTLGAEIYVGITLKQGKTTLRYSGSTSQVIEQKKLQGYLKILSSRVNQKLGN